MYGEFVTKKSETESGYRLYLVTARHVILDHAASAMEPLWVKFNLLQTSSSDAPAREYAVALTDERGRPTWQAHPNPTVDLAIIPINGPQLRSEGARFDFFRSDKDVLSRARAKQIGLSEGDGIFVLGFPMGLVGPGQEYVVVRQGAIARVRDTLDSPSTVTSFLVDSFVFPGNSGSPVVSKPEIVSISGTDLLP